MEGGGEGWRGLVRGGVEGGAGGHRYRTEPKVRNTCNTDTAKYHRGIGIDC